MESFAGAAAVLLPPTTDRDPVIGQIATLKLAESTGTGEALAAALSAVDAFNAQILGEQIGFQIIQADTSKTWLALGTLISIVAAAIP